MELKRASLKKRIWFYLTCWLPVTRYKFTKNMEFFMKFAVAVNKDHMNFQKDIQALKKVVAESNYKEKENIEKGMYE